MSEKSLPIHYRFSDVVDSDGLYLVEEKWHPIRETKCCYFMVRDWHLKYYKLTGKQPSKGNQKRVLKHSRRRFAYPDRDEAFRSYLQRKSKQCWHAKTSMQTANAALSKFAEQENAPEMKTKDRLYIGYPGFLRELIFED